MEKRRFLLDEVNKIGIELSDTQVEQFIKYYELSITFICSCLFIVYKKRETNIMSLLFIIVCYLTIKIFS